MTLTLQLILIILSIFLFIILIRSVKKGKLRSDYALVWLLCSIALIIVAIFPQIAYFAADFIGVISTANMVLDVYKRQPHITWFKLFSIIT